MFLKTVSISNELIKKEGGGGLYHCLNYFCPSLIISVGNWIWDTVLIIKQPILDHFTLLFVRCWISWMVFCDTEGSKKCHLGAWPGGRIYWRVQHQPMGHFTHWAEPGSPVLTGVTTCLRIHRGLMHCGLRHVFLLREEFQTKEFSSFVLMMQLFSYAISFWKSPKYTLHSWKCVMQRAVKGNRHQFLMTYNPLQMCL